MSGFGNISGARLGRGRLPSTDTRGGTRPQGAITPPQGALDQPTLQGDDRGQPIDDTRNTAINAPKRTYSRPGTTNSMSWMTQGLNPPFQGYTYSSSDIGDWFNKQAKEQGFSTLKGYDFSRRWEERMRQGGDPRPWEKEGFDFKEFYKEILNTKVPRPEDYYRRRGW